MFNFNTQKERPESDAKPVNNNKASNTDSDKEAFINAKIDEIEAQRIEFMKKEPSFDMKAEMENPDFVNYVWKNGLSIEDAYFLVHRDEIIEKGVKSAMERIAAKRNRISENGAGKNSPASVRKNPKDMSDKEIDSIIERVRNGEKISF